MKKFIVLLVVLLSATFFVTAQNTGITSVLSDTSQGIFENELDAAANVGSEFATIGHSFVFAGLANIELLEADESNNYDNGGSPLWGGFYKSGDKPWSVFLGFTASDSNGNEAGGMAFTGMNTETVTVGTTDTDYQWYARETETKYTANQIFENMSIGGQLLLMLGSINTGLYFNMDLVLDNDGSGLDQQSNYTLTENNFYNTVAAVPNAVPVVAADYTMKITETLKDSQTDFTLGIPFFLQSGDSSHEANLRVGLGITDNSTTYVEDYTGTPNAPQTFQNVDNQTIAKEVALDISGSYTLTLPGLGDGNKDNEFEIGGGAGFGLAMPTYKDSAITQDYTYAGAQAVGVIDVRSESEVEATFTNGFDFNAGLNIAHSFNYDLGSIVKFAMKPSAYVWFANSKDGMVDSIVSITRTDNDNDGFFTSAVDTITTTTTTYTNSSYDATLTALDATTVTDIYSSISLPMAITVSPEKWPFSVTLGSTPRLWMNNKITKTLTTVNSTNDSTVDGTGAAVGNTTVVNAATSDETTVVDTSVTVSAAHSIGLNMPIGEFVQLDINLNMSSGDAAESGANSSILNFRDFTIQAIIALP
ncbi:MAG: hypothetical protein PF518_09160 [Spirochaetaceae bacterium]|jgi:hypothetical protein|nr:hypothetical protein [Spirochaetaceae bacterium]